MKIGDLYYLKKHPPLVGLISTQYDYEEISFKDVDRGVREEMGKGEASIAMACSRYIDFIRSGMEFRREGKVYFYLEMTDSVDLQYLRIMFPELQETKWSLSGIVDASRLDALFEAARAAFPLRSYNNETPWCLFELIGNPTLVGVDALVGFKINYFDFVGKNISHLRNWIGMSSWYAGIFTRKQTGG